MIKLFEQWLQEQEANGTMEPNPKVKAEPAGASGQGEATTAPQPANPQPAEPEPTVPLASRPAETPPANAPDLSQAAETNLNNAKSSADFAANKRQKVAEILKDQPAGAYILVDGQMQHLSTIKIISVGSLGDDAKLDIQFTSLEELKAESDEKKAAEKRPGFIKLLNRIGSRLDAAFASIPLVQKIEKLINKKPSLVLKKGDALAGFVLAFNDKVTTDPERRIYNKKLEDVVRDAFFTTGQFGVPNVPNVGVFAKNDKQPNQQQTGATQA